MKTRGNFPYINTGDIDLPPRGSSLGRYYHVLIIRQLCFRTLPSGTLQLPLVGAYLSLFYYYFTPTLKP